MFAEVSPFVQAARQDAERVPLGQGPNRNWTSKARPGLAQGQGCPQRTLTDARDGEGQSPSARAVGQTGEPREPDAEGRTSGGEDLWCYLPKRAGLSKVTRQAAQRRRNTVEDGVLASRIAKQHGKDATGPLTLALSHKGRGDGYRGRLRFANRPYSTPSIDPKPYLPRGEGIIYPGTMRFAYWHPTCLPQGERGWLPRTITLR